MNDVAAVALPTVLVVEDDALTVEYMTILLSPRYQVHSAVSADEALCVLSHTSVDIILMDVSLCGVMDGLDLTRNLRGSEEYRNIPIIVTTAHAYQAMVDDSYQAGCNAYLSKPVNRKELLETMSRLLGPSLS